MTETNQTAEQVAADALRKYMGMLSNPRAAAAADIVADLRAHGLLAGGAPAVGHDCEGDGNPCELPTGEFSCTLAEGHSGVHVACDSERHDLTGALAAAAGLLSEGAPSDAHLDRLRLATEDAAGGPPSMEQVEALIDLVDALEVALAAASATQQAPSDEQIERAARALFEDPHMSADYTWAEMVEDDPTRAEVWRIDARRALTAAGVAPQSLHAEKVAEELMGHEFNALGQCTCGHATPDYGSGNRLRIEEKRHFARALCAADAEGRLR